MDIEGFFKLNTNVSSKKKKIKHKWVFLWLSGTIWGNFDNYGSWIIMGFIFGETIMLVL